MAATQCESCGGKVHEQARACPHCGAKRANVTPGTFTQEEVRALLTTNGQVVDETGNSLAASLLFPHPHTVGPARTIEIVLTIVCAPLVLVGTAVMMMSRLRRSTRTLIKAARGEGMAALAMTLLGGLTFYSVLDLFHAPAAGSLTVASILCLWIRAYIRSRSEAWRPEDLAKLPPGPRPSKPQLPTARAVAKPVTAPDAVPTAPRVDPPRAEPPTAPGDEPRLLR